MFDFHYDYIRQKYDDAAEFLFTDTDSLMYLIYTDDFYHDISHDIERPTNCLVFVVFNMSWDLGAVNVKAVRNLA